MTADDGHASTPPRRGAGFWLQVAIGPAPATLFIAPRLLRWSWLFGFGLTMRLETASASTPSLASSVLLSAYYLGWAVFGLLGILCLWAALLADRQNLRRRLRLRALVLAGLLAGLLAVAQFLLHPLVGVDFRRQPYVLLLLAGPVAVTIYQGWLLLRRRPDRAP